MSDQVNESYRHQLREDRAKSLRKAGVPDDEIPAILSDLAELDQAHMRSLQRCEQQYIEDREHLRREWMEEAAREAQRATEKFIHKGEL